MDSIVDTISLYLQNPTSSEFLKVAATQMLNKIQKYTNKIYDKTAFITAILTLVKLELMSNNMNNEANYAVFNNIFRIEYSSPIVNNSSTNSETLNLTYTEQIVKKIKNKCTYQ
ncbi:24856_t:CDS:1 [Gigaspora margarita]|uniref:24856_t:CDS:1 n=1 Tax=Gigaspora margarita TaxID=4874 RepID=A0ABN7V721_GIGMA|nr:24856_t:CDS:1 [Gigaspora margarita]